MWCWSTIGFRRYQLPCDAVVSTKGDHDIVVHRNQRCYSPGFLDQRNTGFVAGQTVEIGTVEAREGFESIQRIGLRKNFHVEFDDRLGSVDTGTSAGGLFVTTTVRCTVCAKEKSRVAACSRLDQRPPIRVDTCSTTTRKPENRRVTGAS